MWGEWAKDDVAQAPVYKHSQNATFDAPGRRGYPSDVIKLADEQWFQFGNERVVMVAN